jgi:hypothetical protein
VPEVAVWNWEKRVLRTAVIPTWASGKGVTVVLVEVVTV